ncbi:hypothetical protein DHEL01_v201097 [Diaporthe helianthi]|uniref:Uncharacterized protein n=1 Tax=Diaporthe helianthi TaxID=158607 RepID=A0A2P5IDD1_DIAHE|nr:hypothetical protein DHEL01_v201097 [Diaporthe helianthi]
MRNVFLRAKPTRFGSLPPLAPGRLHLQGRDAGHDPVSWGVDHVADCWRAWRAIRLDEAVVDCYRYTHYCSEPDHPTVTAGPGSEINFARVAYTVHYSLTRSAVGLSVVSAQPSTIIEWMIISGSPPPELGP